MLNLTTKANYIYNIEKINCLMLKNYPFHKENEEQYWIKKEQKYRLTYEYKEKFGERYIDNLTPCERQAVLKNLNINSPKY